MNILEHLERNSIDSYRAAVLTKSGKLIMSVIADAHAYCSPRAFLQNPEEYKSFEVGIFNAETEDWASYNEAKPALELLDGEREYDMSEDLDAPQCVVFGYVSIENINKAWELL